MPVHVRFRLNKLTGEVEEFLVDDQDRRLPEAEHDRIAAEVGRVIARRPRLHEVLPHPAPPAGPTRREDPDHTDAQTETETGTETPHTHGGTGR